MKDPRNHCVPILDHFPDDKEPYTEFIVMPFLRPFNDPPFCYVDEVIDFVRQSLEVHPLQSTLDTVSETVFKALSFIHGQNVAHRYESFAIHSSSRTDLQLATLLS